MAHLVREVIQRISAHMMKVLFVNSPQCSAETLAAALERQPGNPVHDIFYRHGFHLLRKHFYLRVPEEEDMPEGFWSTRTDLVGLEINDQKVLDLIEGLQSIYE
jgi:hypothetical protein